MKRPIVLLGLAAIAFLGGCATDNYDGSLYASADYPFDGYYDGYYGPIYDGYWGNNGYFYYRSGASGAFIRGDRSHFRQHGATPGGRFQSMQGHVRPAPGTRMPHFGGGPGHPPRPSGQRNRH